MPHIVEGALRALNHIKIAGREVRILVVGDLILDRFLYGSVERISPEAPVPVVEVERELARPGGATNVVNNLLAMGAKVSLAGVVGDDPAAAQLMGILDDPAVELGGVVTDGSRPTAVKTRVIAQHQQIVRYDRESKAPLPKDVAANLAARAGELALGAAMVIVSDYGKAVVREETMDALRRASVPFAVDPKPLNKALYRGAAVITPNAKETYELCGVKPVTNEDAELAGRLVSRGLTVNSVLVTRGEKGMTLMDPKGQASHIPTRARDVFDVTGAGDTAISLYALSLACGAAPFDAACLANAASGIVVGKLGTATVTAEELEAALTESGS